MTDIYFKEEGDADWRRWSYTDGDPTGREYNCWLPAGVTLDIKSLANLMNENVCAIYEKKIQPISLKFNVRECPDESSPYFGYAYMDRWTTRHYELEMISELQ